MWSSGKSAAWCFRVGPHGAFMRPRTIPKQPRTEAQMRVRNSFTAGSAGWAELSNPQKAGWSALAQTVTLTNRVGKPYKPTGRRLFMSCWQNSATAFTDGPGDAPAFMPSIPAPANFNVTAAPAGTGHPQGAITLGGQYPITGGTLVLRVTPPLSFDKTYLGPNDYRVLTIVPEGGAQPTPASLGALYAARFGVIQPGARIGFAAVPDGRFGLCGADCQRGDQCEFDRDGVGAGRRRRAGRNAAQGGVRRWTKKPISLSARRWAFFGSSGRRVRRGRRRGPSAWCRS